MVLIYYIFFSFTLQSSSCGDHSIAVKEGKGTPSLAARFVLLILEWHELQNWWGKTLSSSPVPISTPEGHLCAAYKSKLSVASL